MAETFNDNVVINGQTDTIQLSVKGVSSQSEALQIWLDDSDTVLASVESNGAVYTRALEIDDSSENVLARITDDGRLQLGSAELMGTDDALIEAHRHEDDTGKPSRGLHIAGAFTGALTSIISWIVQELTLKGTAGISALHSAMRVRLTNENTGTMTGANLRVGDFELINNGGSSENGVPEVTGLSIQITNQESGYIDTAYGLKIAVNQDPSGTVEKIYAIHANDGIVHINSILEMQPTDTPPDGETDIVKLYPKTDGKIYAKSPNGTEYDLTGGGGASSLDDLTDVDTSGASNGQVLTFDGTTWEPQTPSGGGVGNVTSVGLTLPSEFSVGGSPVTNSGTLAGSWANQSANTVLSGPSTGSPTSPTFRALVEGDIPNLAATKIASGTLDPNRVPTMVGDSGSGGTKGAVPAPVSGDATKFLRGDGTWQTPSGGSSSGLARGYFAGLEVSCNSSNQLTLSAGLVRSDDNADDIATNSFNFSPKSVTVGDPNGLDTGSFAASTWYYIFVIKNLSSGVVAGLLSVSGTPTLPSGYTRKRLVGFVRTDTSVNFKPMRTLPGDGNLREVREPNDVVIINGISMTGTTTVDISDECPPLTTHAELYIRVTVQSTAKDLEWFPTGLERFYLFYDIGSITADRLSRLPVDSNREGRLVISDTSGNESLFVIWTGCYWVDLTPSLTT